MGKWIVLAGLVIVVVGLIVVIGQKIGIPFGRLPGDISIQGEKTSFYFPLVTGLILSVILTVVINFVIWMLKK